MLQVSSFFFFNEEKSSYSTYITPEPLIFHYPFPSLNVTQIVFSFHSHEILSILSPSVVAFFRAILVELFLPLKSY